MLRNDRFKVKKQYKSDFDVHLFVIVDMEESDGFDIMARVYDPTADRRRLIRLFKDTIDFNMEKINGQTS